MALFRGKIPTDSIALICALRPPAAPTEVLAEVEGDITLFGLGTHLRDELMIPERGYGPKLGYLAHLEVSDEQQYSPMLLSLQPEYATSPVPSYLPYLARAGGPVLWGHTSADFKVADLLYSQDVGLVPRTDIVSFLIGDFRSGGGGVELLPWDQVPQFIEFLRDAGQGVVSNLGSEAIVGALGWLLGRLHRKRERFEERRASGPAPVFNIARIVINNKGRADELDKLMGISKDEARVAVQHVEDFHKLVDAYIDWRFREEQVRYGPEQGGSLWRWLRRRIR